MKIDRQNFTATLLQTAHDCVAQSNDPAAMGLFERILRDQEQTFGPSSIKLAPVLSELSECYGRIGLDLKAQECRCKLSSLLRDKRA
jgi:hypothetical protein